MKHGPSPNHWYNLGLAIMTAGYIGSLVAFIDERTPDDRPVRPLPVGSIICTVPDSSDHAPCLPGLSLVEQPAGFGAFLTKAGGIEAPPGLASLHRR